MNYLHYTGFWTGWSSFVSWRLELYICPPKLNYNHAKGWVFTDCGQLANSLQQYLHSCGIIAACPMCSDSAVTSFVKLLRFCEDTQPSPDSPAQPRQPSTIEIESPSCCHIVNIIWKTPSWSRSCRWRCLIQYTGCRVVILCFISLIIVQTSTLYSYMWI